ncbi:dihydrofolate reductase [Metabacillus sp. RGM 3146]|uniref:dihydrofolate reductase n=1 Tax=Metabacillus sp. RGM 3146 TaxID=3401092 RepID=UPI003B99007B
MISFLLAMDKNRLIGKDNDLPWRLPADLAYFKKVTMGHKIVMGRKTFESMGRPLPGRDNIILTRDPSFEQEGAEVIHSAEAFLKQVQESEEEIFVIGGAEIFKWFLPYCERMYITEIGEEFEGDRYFPEVDEGEWEVNSRIKGIKDEKNPYDYEFLIYNRKQTN